MEKTGKSYAAQDRAFVDSTIAEYTSKFPSGSARHRSTKT
tara:strand:+ start:327 stop:446 length:120 start_codon:yes stop_codon:yes gene_type:complete